MGNGSVCRVVDGEVAQNIEQWMGRGSVCRVVDGEMVQCIE